MVESENHNCISADGTDVLRNTSCASANETWHAMNLLPQRLARAAVLFSLHQNLKCPGTRQSALIIMIAKNANMESLGTAAFQALLQSTSHVLVASLTLRQRDLMASSKHPNFCAQDMTQVMPAHSACDLAMAARTAASTTALWFSFLTPHCSMLPPKASQPRRHSQTAKLPPSHSLDCIWAEDR